jgi:hypothetical protein
MKKVFVKKESLIVTIKLSSSQRAWLKTNNINVSALFRSLLDEYIARQSKEEAQL